MTSIWRTETIFNLEEITDMGLGFLVFAEDKAVVSADKTSVVSAGKTSVVSADKTSVVSADKTSVVSQDIPFLLTTWGRRRRPPVFSIALDVLGDHRCPVC